MPKKLNILFLIVICVSSVLLISPTIRNNIDSPNLIPYFNPDEGYLMDLIWSYYSGEIRATYQGSVDYGLEMILLSDFSHIVLSKYIDFTPGTFVLILRWIHLLAWVGALVALWRFVGRHFGEGLEQILAVLLLAVRPSLSYLSNSLKPEPLVLLIMIIGFDFVLRIVDRPSIKSLVIALLCASVAFHIKFAGIFLLPSVIAAIYFGQRSVVNRKYIKSVEFFKLEKSYIFELIIGMFLIMLPFVYILYYVRISTGTTFYEDFGVWKSLLMFKISFFPIILGLMSFGLAFLLFKFNLNIDNSKRKFIEKINEINSYAFIVVGIFSLLVLLFASRWIMNPQAFSATYSYNALDFVGAFALRHGSSSKLLIKYVANIKSKIMSFDLILMGLFVVYLIIEIYRRKEDQNKLQLYKRKTLLFFFIPFVFIILSPGRFAQHHMLPFFVIVVVLIIQELTKSGEMQSKSFYRRGITVFIYALIVFDIVLNGTNLVKLRLYRFNQEKDISYEVGDWLHKNISKNAVILSEVYTRVYIPDDYKKIKIFDGCQENISEQLLILVKAYSPQFIYRNERDCDDRPVFTIKNILSDKKLEVFKSFDSTGRSFQRGMIADKFVIYRIL